MTVHLPSIAEITRRAAQAAFGKPLVVNVQRGLVAEAIVAAALEPDWRWCSEDYSSWDFEHRDGTRLEVKQSAARQSWSTTRPSSCSFDIAPRTGRYEGGTRWIEEAGRNADIYILAHHPIFDGRPDHRDPGQWLFYVIPTRLLPPSRRIALGPVNRLVAHCGFTELKERVATVAGSRG